MRGTGVLRKWLMDVPRFIPARAGNGSTPVNNSDPMAVHPRACGERSIKNPDPDVTYGSSPRVRGPDAQWLTDCAVTWFIPARAGNGLAGFAEARFQPVHPRACGERTSCV